MDEPVPPLLDFYGAPDSGGPGMRLIGIDAEELPAINDPAMEVQRLAYVALREAYPLFERLRDGSTRIVSEEPDISLSARIAELEAENARLRSNIRPGVNPDPSQTWTGHMIWWPEELQVPFFDGEIGKRTVAPWSVRLTPTKRLSSGWEHLPDVTRPEPKTMPARALTGRAAQIGLRVP